MKTELKKFAYRFMLLWASLGIAIIACLCFILDAVIFTFTKKEFAISASVSSMLNDVAQFYYVRGK